MLSLSRKLAQGFTLAELLISLAILGVIATFTIPKILSTQQSQQNISVVKEVASMISGSYQAAKYAGVITSSSKAADLTPYMNYVNMDITNTYDGPPTISECVCSAATPCLRLHNGGILYLSDENFGGTNTTNVIQFIIDPNGVQDSTSTADGPGKAVQFELYYDGFITTRGAAKSNSCHSVTCPFGPNSVYDPSWFQW